MSTVSPNPRRPDVATLAWAGLTVRITWTLLAERAKVTPQALRDARDHVLFHLEPSALPENAEDQAGNLTAEFVRRARREAQPDPWPQDAAMTLSARWRRALDHSLHPLTESIFRQHYGDGRSLEQLESALQVDRIALEGARGGLREVVRRAAGSDGVPIDGWPPERVDRLLARLAAFSPGPCPPLIEVVGGNHREHQLRCARCDRTVRLLKAGVIREEDLVPPALDGRPTHRVRVLALHFHPEGRWARRWLASELDVPSAALGDDVLLIDLGQPEAVFQAVQLAAEVNTPHRDLIRGAVFEGPGRWSRHGLLGPLSAQASQLARTRSWGTVDGLGELPHPLPPPPSARPWWGAAAMLSVAAAACVAAAVRAPTPTDAWPLHVEFVEGRGGVWAAFDVDERAHVGVVREADGHLDVIASPRSHLDKLEWALGDGSYRVHAMGRGALVVSSPGPLRDLRALAEAASQAEDPLRDLASRVQAVHPEAVVAWRRRP